MVNSVSTRGIVTDGDLAANAASFARHLRAANLTPATQRAYLDGLTLLARFLTAAGMPTDVPADELPNGCRPAGRTPLARCDRRRIGWTVWRA
jgi:hypothetical protein